MDGFVLKEKLKKLKVSNPQPLESLNELVAYNSGGASA
jgi:hypothetical protein